jgi:phage host-nuclease inhibitor protein Gam
MSDSPGQYNGQAQPSRLEQIELLLLQTTASLNRVSQQQEVNTQAIAQLGDKQQVNTQAIAQLGDKQQVNTQAIAQLGDKQQVNTQAIAQLGDKIDRLADRQERFQVQLEESISELIKTIDYAVDRTEEVVRRFLEQSSNGH